MAILRRGRRGRPAGPGDVAPPPPGPPPGPGLDERLRQIAATAAPEEALDPALRAIVDSAKAHAGAICLFDPRYGLLRLAAEVGLSDEGCKRLRNVRRGDPDSWDIPLHGLINRRAYLIESAPRNRYVPRLVEAAASVRTVTCVPLYAGSTPLGSLVLIAVAPRYFTERDIRILEGPLRELSAIIQAARRRGSVDEVEVEPPPRAPAATELAQLIGERDRLRAELAERETVHAGLAAESAAREAERAGLAAELAARAADVERLGIALGAVTEERTRLAAELERTRQDAERTRGLASSLAAADRERARVAAALEAAAAEQASRARITTDLEQALAEAGRSARAMRAELETVRRALDAGTAAASARENTLALEVTHLRDRVTEAEAAAARDRELVHEHERQQERLTLDLRAAETREQQLRDDLRAATERTLSDAQGELRPALAAARAAEEGRVEALAEAQVARTALENAQSVIEALEAEGTRAHADSERLETDWRAVCAAQERLEFEAQSALADAQAARAQGVRLTGELGALREERDRGMATGRDAEAAQAALGARLESLAAERDRLREDLAGMTAERDHLAAERSDAVAARARLEDTLARESAQRAELAAALAPLQATVAALEATLARYETEAAGRTVEIDRLRAERDRLAAERFADVTAQALASAETPPTAPALASAETPPTAPAAPEPPLRVVTMAAAAGRAWPRDGEPALAVVAVVDADDTWEAAEVDEHRVVVVPPGEGAAARLHELAPRRLVANLAAPGTLATLTAFRATGATTRAWGCLAAPAGDRALLLGLIETAVRPLDPDTILALLGRYASRGTRVVTAGADVDALMSLRQALSRGGMSVSMAWDATQATDLLGVVKPEVVLIDLELPRREGYSIVARLAALDPVPTAVLIPGGGDPAGAFAAILAQPVYRARCRGLRDVLTGIVGRSEAPPSARPEQPKVRVLTRK